MPSQISSDNELANSRTCESEKSTKYSHNASNPIRPGAQDPGIKPWGGSGPLDILRL